jgi:hypothetical protein
MRKQSTGNKGNKKQKHHVFIILAHGAIKTNLIKIDTRETNYYDFGKEMYTLVTPFDFSEFAKYSVNDAVHFLKENRGVPTNDGGIAKFENIIDKSTTDRYGYIFDRDLWMYPFVSDGIERGVLANNDPSLFKVGVYEVNPNGRKQPNIFLPLSKYTDLSKECRDGLNQIAKELNDMYMIAHNRTVTQYSIRNFIYGLSRLPLVGSLVNSLFNSFASYIKHPAFKELTQDSVIPINKESFTLSEIMAKLREIPKYKKGIHHIIIQACYGSLSNTEQIEQILKTQQNQSKIKVSVRESYYIDSKKVYDISSDNQSLLSDDPIYHLLEMINIEKSHIVTVERDPNIFEKIKSYVPFCTKSNPNCVLTQEKISIDTIISICNIAKTWLEILKLDPHYLDVKRQFYIISFNKKYGCSETIDKEKIKNILEDKKNTFIPKVMSIIKFDEHIQKKLSECPEEQSQEEYLRELIIVKIHKQFLLDKNILEDKKNTFIPKVMSLIKFDAHIQKKLSECPEELNQEEYLRELIIVKIHKQFLLDKNVLDEFNKLLKAVSITAVYDDKVYAIYDLMKNPNRLTTQEQIKIIDFFGTDKNKQIMNILLDKEYIDTEAETHVQNEVEKGAISEDQRIEEYNRIKKKNIESTIDRIFSQVHMVYAYETFPKMVHNSDLDESYWNSLSLSQLIKLFRTVERFILIKQQYVLV